MFFISAVLAATTAINRFPSESSFGNIEKKGLTRAGKKVERK